MALLCGKFSFAQLSINNAQFFIQSGATVTVQGDLTSNTDILGTGKVLLKGSGNQNVNMNGFTIPNLEMDNAANATLTGNARIGSSLQFTNGKIILGTNDLRLSDVATTAGGGPSKFVETNGTGKLVKEITTNLTNYEMPVGTGTEYSPALLTTSATYSSATAAVQAKAGASPNKHPRSTDFLNRYWTITRTGITGTLTATGQYNDPTDVAGVETDLRGIFWDGTTWSLAGSSIDYATNRATSTVATSGDLYAMNRFTLLKATAFLQGAFNTGTGFMNDNLRTAPNQIPTTDPYRSAPYNANFTHVANTVPETVAASVFNDLGNNDNIVDWVFVELRTTVGNPGANVLQTRSGLIQKDGDIVDIDGVSPLFFKNVDAGTQYTVAIRHRNHLGLSTNPATNLRTLNETTPVAATDFSTFSAAQLFGAATTNYTVLNGKNVLYGGNANHNTVTRYGAAANDRATILADLGNNENGVSAAGYHRSDVNMNRIVRYGAAQNDRAFILTNVLGNNENGFRNQALPQ